MAYEYKNRQGIKYYLHKKEITLRGSGKKQVIYYFKKNTDSNKVNDLPEGFLVVESKRSGLPVLKKK